MKKIDKHAMLEDIILSISCILSVVIMYFISKSTGWFHTHSAVDYVNYSICIVVLTKASFHVIKWLYGTIVTKNKKEKNKEVV